MLLLLYLVVSISCISADLNNSSISEDDQKCWGTFNSSEFYLASPGLPARYPSNLQCTWIVEASPSSCGLTLEIGNLGLSRCPSDWLVVGGVQLCGDLPRIVNLPLHRPRTNVTFKGNAEGGIGFNITVRQTECSNHVLELMESHKENLENFSCGGEFFGNDIIIKSPGYPSSYPAGANCEYTIRRSNDDICQVEITFENSSIEISDGCYKDRLEIQGDRLCGDLKGVRTYSIENTLDIRFMSDSERSAKGFKLLVKQIKCSDTPIVVDALEENDKQDVLVDCVTQGVQTFPPFVEEGYPRARRPFLPFPLPNEVNNYPKQQNYMPQNGFLGNPSVQRIPLRPHSQQFHWKYPSTSLPSNNVYPVHPYSPPNSRLPFNQGSVPNNPNFPISYNPVYINPSPFQAPYTPPFSQIQQCCGRVYSDGHFLIVSPGFPRSQSSDCIYTIQRYSPSTFQLRFQFRYFWVGQDNGSGCSGGALEIDGSRICGCKTGIIWTSQFLDSEAVKVLHLSLDSTVDRLFNGFVIEVYQDDSYSGRYKRDETNPSRDEFSLPDGKLVNFTQYVETVVEREPLILQNNDNQLMEGTYGQLVWDPNRQTWTLPTDIFCLRWSFQDWILLAKETLWSQYQCPVPNSLGSVTSVDSSRFDITACRTCFYFCRQNCQCC